MCNSSHLLLQRGDLSLYKHSPVIQHVKMAIRDKVAKQDQLAKRDQLANQDQFAKRDKLANRDRFAKRDHSAIWEMHGLVLDFGFV